MPRIHISTPEEEEQDSVQESTDWKHIIFLPFQRIWELCLMISIFFNAILSMYDLYFARKTAFTISLLYYIFELMYLIDCVLAVMHRNLTVTRKKRSYPTRNLGVILADCLTLHPVYEIYYFLSLTNYSTGEEMSRNNHKWKCVVRSYRIFLFEMKQMNQVGLNQLLILPIQRLFKIAVIGQLFASIIYKLAEKDELNWTANLDLYEFNRNSTVQWWSYCFMMMSGVFINNWSNFVKPENAKERLTFTAAMLLGFFISVTLYLGRLVMIFMRINRSYFDFDLHVTQIMTLLDEWEVDDDLKSKTFDYYTMFYKQRKGMRKVPELFNSLPPSLQKEVTVDIYWEALRHTHFFTNTDMSFKRSVSLVMKSGFLLPGEFLFRVGEVKAKMVYLVSGVVQAMSKEDDDSPIISFSSGTIFGETACLMPSSSVANLRAVTYCEIQYLHLTDLYQVLLKYPYVMNSVRRNLLNRLQIAWNGITKRREKISDVEYTDTSIKNVRTRWKEISKYSKKPELMPAVKKDERLNCVITNLDLLVLSDEVELRIESICLSGKCPFMMDPDSGFRKCCDFAVIIAIIAQGIIVPKAAFFYDQMEWQDFAICLLFDAVYLLDIYFQLATAYRDKNKLITNFKELVIKLLKKVTFLIDVIASIPIDYLFYISGSNVNIGLVKLPRLMKIYKILILLFALQHTIRINTTVVRVFKWFIFYLITIYWFTGFLYGISRLASDSDPLRFWETIMLTLSAYVGYGGSNIHRYTLMEMIAYFILTICGHIFSSFGMAELIAMAVLRHKSGEVDRVQWWVMKSELVRQKLDSSIRQRLSRFLYFHNTVRSWNVVGQHSIFEDAPTELRNEVVRHRITDCLKKVPLFQDAKRDVLRYICAHAEIKIVPPGALLIDCEVKSDTLYVVMRGYCILSSFLPGDAERNATSILEIGDTFPFLEILHDTLSFVNVQCLTVVELLLIKKHVVNSALQTYENDYQCYKDALNEHKKIFGSILYRRGARLPQMRSLERSKGKGNIFVYDIYDVDDIEFNKTAYKKPFFDLGMWSFLRFLMLRHSIRPNNWPFICWEVTRCFMLIVYLLLLNIRYSILNRYLTRSVSVPMSLVFDFVALLDMYIRLHCQYYNEKGILVTHPLYTAKNYIKTAFVMDFLGIVQMQSLGLDRLFGREYALWVQVLVSLGTRCCQLYRPFKGLSYLDGYFQGKKRNAINMFRFVLLIVLSISFGCILTMLVMCEHKSNVFYCAIDNSTIVQGGYQYFYYLYTVTICVTLSSAGNVIENYKHLILTVFILIPMVCMKWLFFVSVTSRGVGGNVELTIYRDRMKNYVKFLKGAIISDEDKQLIVSHYEYIWKKTHGLDMHTLIKSFHPQLEQDLARAIYLNCLRKVQLFSGEHTSLFHAISTTLRQEFYTKDTKIIRCNDIHDKLCFVHDGGVDVYIANTLMCELRTGGVFGCFSRSGVTRQTITAVARIHSLVLTVDTKLFYKTLEAFPKIMERLQRANALNYEYMPEVQDSMQILEEKRKPAYMRNDAFYGKILIFENNSLYRFFDYIINVHIYPLSSILILTATFVNMYVPHPSYILGICYCSDFIHLVKMSCKYHLIYVDPESGRVISDPYAIRKKYLKTGFWFDFFTLLPFEMIADSYTGYEVIYNLCFMNRTLRFIFLVLYYYQCEERLLMKDHLKWTYMIYSVMFQLHVFLCLWLLVACPNVKCWYRSGFLPTDNTNVQANTTMDSTILGYLYVTNIYSGTGLRSISPIRILELVVTLIMMITTQVLLMNLCSNYISHMLVNKYNFINYEVRFQSLGTYLQNLRLSPFLYSKVWKYCLRLWSRERGDWLPVLITESPPCLKENVLQILYGRHLYNHYLFCNTHIDFLRQLVAHLDRFVFSTGDSIVEKGDADCCMYFVNSGEIMQLDIYGKMEHFVGTLEAGSSFGEAQGLLCISHKYSYRAKGDSEVLILNKSKWNYLLKWFPASKEQIIAKGISSGLLDEDDTI